MGTPSLVKETKDTLVNMLKRKSPNNKPTKDASSHERAIENGQSPDIYPIPLSLWRRLLLSADAIPPSLHAGSVHACGDEDAARQVPSRSGIAKLEVSLVLGRQDPESPPSEVCAKLSTTVNANALSRITFLCLSINPQMTLSLVTASLDGVFNASLSNLESLMIASAAPIDDLFGPLTPLLHVIDETSLNLRSLYLENINRDFIVKASTSHWWSRLARLTVRNETDPINASLFALSTRLEFLSFSGELSYGPENHDQPIDFPHLQWLRVGVILMSTLRKLQIPKLHSMVIHTVQGNYPLPAPPHHTLLMPELKILHVATVNITVACIVAPKLETLCLGIPTLRNTDANNILDAIFDGHELMIKPKHLTLTVPVHDKHLLHALALLPDLMSLQLDHEVPLTEGFFRVMTSSKSRCDKKCSKLKCLGLDLHEPACTAAHSGKNEAIEDYEREEMKQRERRGIKEYMTGYSGWGVDEKKRGNFDSSHRFTQSGKTRNNNWKYEESHNSARQLLADTMQKLLVCISIVVCCVQCVLFLRGTTTVN